MATPISNIAPGLSNSVFAPKLGGQLGSTQTSSPAVSNGGAYNPWQGTSSAYNSSFTPPTTPNVTGFSNTGQAQTSSNQSQNSSGTTAQNSSGTPYTYGQTVINGVVQPSSQTNPTTPVSGVGTNLFPGIASGLASTQPYNATNNAVGSSQSLATGYGLTPQQTQNQNNINQGAQTSANIAQNQTPQVQGAYSKLANFEAQAPNVIATQANIPMAANVSVGRGQVLGNQIAGETQGLANAYGQAVQGEAQQLTGAQQQAQAGQANINSQLQGAQQAGQISNQAQANQIGAQTSALQAIQPQLSGYGQTYYNPLQAGTQQGGIGGVTGPAAAGVVQGQANAGQTYTQNQAILGKVSAQLPALGQLIQSSGYNSNPVAFANQLQQWGAGTLSNSSIPEVQGSLNDIVASLSQVLGVPSGQASDFRTQFAGQIVNGLQSGQSIEQALQFAVNQATAGNQGYLQGATGQTGNQTGGQTNTSGGLYNF